EGPIHHAHGGSLAAVLDEAMGSACWIQGHRVLAGTLTIRYRRPVPLGSVALVRTEVVGVDGRKVTTRGAIADPGGGVYVEAEGTFVRMRPEQEQAFLDAARERGDYAMPDAY
ncbi:MAG TPA: PaaI family thioesterase, partial [Myxococcota bacterium]|nr:PaaI family thioesterase [Myxococcota bacterium]